MPPSKSKLQAVVEESTQNAPSITTAVKSIANVLLGPRGQTPIDNIIQMQHYQLWGFILIVAGLLYIVWLMQKKLDSIDKQYKEQFVLLHRLFKSHQDLQVEVRKKPMSVSTTTTISVPQQQEQTSLELEEEDELVFDEHQSEPDQLEEESVQEESSVQESSVQEESSAQESSVQQQEEQQDYEVFE
jgi:hypothetical protein